MGFIDMENHLIYIFDPIGRKATDEAKNALEVLFIKQYQQQIIKVTTRYAIVLSRTLFDLFVMNIATKIGR